MTIPVMTVPISKTIPGHAQPLSNQSMTILDQVHDHPRPGPRLTLTRSKVTNDQRQVTNDHWTKVKHEIRPGIT